MIESVLPQLETIIVLALEQTEELKDFDSLSVELGVKPNTLRKWLERKKLIAIKRNNKWLSHSYLVV